MYGYTNGYMQLFTIVASICTSFMLLCGKPDKDAKYSGGNINNTSHASVQYSKHDHQWGIF